MLCVQNLKINSTTDKLLSKPDESNKVDFN